MSMLLINTIFYVCCFLAWTCLHSTCTQQPIQCSQKSKKCIFFKTMYLYFSFFDHLVWHLFTYIYCWANTHMSLLLLGHLTLVMVNQSKFWSFESIHCCHIYLFKFAYARPNVTITLDFKTKITNHKPQYQHGMTNDGGGSSCVLSKVRFFCTSQKCSRKEAAI